MCLIARLRGALVLLALALPVAARAGSYTVTVQSLAGSSQDSYLREDNSNERNGDKSELRLKASSAAKRRHLVVDMPLPELAGVTILQGWLRLSEFAAGSATPIEARVHALTEDFMQPDVTWDERTFGQAWSTPGGTWDPRWTGRAMVSSLQIGTRVGWQVGPILAAWQLGTLPMKGLAIVPDHDGPDREVLFRSTEYASDLSQTPQLLLHVTDEAPALRSGWAEVQPPAVRVGAVGTPLTLWLDVDAANDTPSGEPTGFDLITLTHGGALAVSAVDAVVVGGTPVPPSQVLWNDNGAALTVRLPNVRAQVNVRIDFRASVLAPATFAGVELPVQLDDSTTPGAWPQVLWPGDADGTSGNGDGWLLAVTATPTVLIDITPDSATVVGRMSAQFQVFGEDAQANRFVVTPDSLTVRPPALGTITPTGLFTGNTPGTGWVAAYSTNRRDSSRVTVTPALLPVVSQVTLRDRQGVATSTMTPLDTMLLDVRIADGNGFNDVRGLELTFSLTGHEDDTGAPAYRAAYRWRRDAPAGWALLDPTGSSWALVPALCAVDTTTGSTAPQTVRLAFVPGRIARASASGAWSVDLRVTSATPPDTLGVASGGYDVAPRLAIAVADTAGSFSAGRAGVIDLALRDPPSGKLTLSFESNADYDLEALARDLVGVSPSDTIHVGGTAALDWAFTSAGGGGALDTAFTALAAGQPAFETETALERDLYLWIDHPVGASSQDYRGRLDLRLRAPAAGGGAGTATVPLTATVTNMGQAAESGIAEVLPKAVQVGTVAESFSAFLNPTFQLGNTGIDHVRVTVPAGYGAPTVTSVRVAGLPVGHTDVSAPGRAAVTLGARVMTPSLIEVRFRADTPVAVDTSGADFVVQFDDTGTPLPPQSATEGNANGLDDGDDWRVTVGPGPLVRIEVEPDSATVIVGETRGFTVAGFDAWDHPVKPVPAWSVTGGIGTIHPTLGSFTATTAGGGRVIAQSGSLADTAHVVVRPARGVAVRRVTGPPALAQADTGALFRVLVENLGSATVALDTVRLVFTRSAPGDAGGDFSAAPRPSQPATLAAADSAWLEFSVAVAAGAVPGSILVGGRVVATEDGTGIVVTDDDADLPHGLTVTAGGFTLAASQLPAPVRPGARGTELFVVTVTNHYPEARSLRSLTATNRTTGPGDPEELDAELGELTLYLDDGDGRLDATRDLSLLHTVAVGGAARFTPLDVPVPAGGSVRLLVGTDTPLRVRDGDALDLRLDDAGSVAFDPPAAARNAWPLDPWGSFPIDGMVADQVAVDTVAAGSALSGARDALALSLLLPANGYASDVLERLGIVNLGTAVAGTDVTGLSAWADDGDGAFAPTADRRLGRMTHTGDRWELTGLSEPVPPAGLRVFVALDLAESAVEGRTLRLALPARPDVGVGMASDNSGPLDRAVANPFDLVISTSDRVTLAAAPIAAATVRPDAHGVTLLHLRATNSYAGVRTLETVTIANAATGAGTVAHLDGNTQSLTLRIDGDADGALDDEAVDPVVGTSFFSGGRATFSGLAWALPPGATRSLFLLADVSRASARDGDVLSAMVAAPSDLGFLEPTTLTAVWPADSRARATVDGMIAAQVTQPGAPGGALAPGSGPALALDLIVPRNGYADDVLASLRVVNLGTAGGADLAELRLWRDGGDGRFTPGVGDDADLGPFAPIGGAWQSPLLAEAIGAAGARLFVGVTTAAGATDSSTVRLAVPVQGIAVQSGNDGPLDLAIANPQTLVISTSPLLAALEVAPAASTVGQAVTLRLVVRNVGGETVTGVAPTALTPAGGGTLAPAGGPTPSSFDVAPGQVDTFTWVFTGSAAGEVWFTGACAGTGQVSGLTRQTAPVASNTHRVFDAVSALELDVVHSMPVSAGRGQPDVVPFSLTFIHPGGPGASPARLRAIRLRLEDEVGAGIVPASLLTKVTVNEGTNVYLIKTALESAGADLDLTLATPATVTGVEPTTVSIRLDVAPGATVPAFRVVIPDSGWFTAEDATSGAPVAVRLQTGAYPVRSGLARLVEAATRVDAQARSAPTLRVARGTAGTTLLAVELASPGIPGISSDVRVASFGVTLTDSGGVPVPRASDHLANLTVRSPLQTLAVRGLVPGDGAGVVLVLNPPLSLPAATPIELTITGDVAAAASLGAVRLRLQDAGSFDARDAGTRAPVPVVYATDPLAGGAVVIEAEAESLLAAGTPSFPASTAIGATGVTALRFVARHPGGPGTARIRLDSLTIACRDGARAPLVPATMLARLRVEVDGVPVADLTGLPTAGSTVAASLGGGTLEPGDSASVRVEVDIRPTAPVAFLELALPGPGLLARDANSLRPVTVAPLRGAELPLLSGLTRLASPPRDLAAGLASRMQATLVPDGREVVAGTLTLTNLAAAGAGPVAIDHLRVLAAAADRSPLPVGAAAERVAAYAPDGSLWAQSAPLTADSAGANLVPAARLDVAPGSPVALELRLVPRAAPGVAGVRLGLEAAGIGVVQPGSALLAIDVRPEPGQAFPMWTDFANFTEAALAGSYANFPNPFAAGRDATTFVYFLPEGARVTLRIWTPRGEAVATLVDGAARAAGLHQGDRWSGRNGAGAVVRNGVYVAELVARYDGGTTERVLRKVAVVR